MIEIKKYPIFVSTVLKIDVINELTLNDIHLVSNKLSETFESFELIVVYQTSIINLDQEVSSKASKNIFVQLSWEQNMNVSYQAGIDFSIGDYVFELEDIKIFIDSEEINYFRMLYEKSTEGYDIVSLSSRKNRFSSRIFYLILNRLTYIRGGISSEFGRIISRRALNATSNVKENVMYRKLLYVLTGYPHTSIQLDKVYLGRKQGFLSKLDFASDILIYYSNVGFNITLILSLGFFFFSVSSIVYTIAIYLSKDVIVEGWMTLMIIISIGFSGIFTILSILSKYIVSILKEVIKRPTYVIKKYDIY